MVAGVGRGMGYMRHHAIVVTSCVERLAKAAHAKAIELELTVTPLTSLDINAGRSFLVAPDGSKEGWSESDAGDAMRATFMSWLDTQRYEDGSSSLKWAEVQYGDEDGDDRILRTHRGPVPLASDAALGASTPRKPWPWP